MNNLKISNSVFEDIKHIDKFGNEFWLARELMVTLEYKKWQKFKNVIDNAKLACENSNNLIEDHFTQVGKVVEIGSKTSRNMIN